MDKAKLITLYIVGQFHPKVLSNSVRPKCITDGSQWKPNCPKLMMNIVTYGKQCKIEKAELMGHIVSQFQPKVLSNPVNRA